MKKKAFSLLTITLLIPLLASCGKKPNDNKGGDSKDPGSGQTYSDKPLVPEAQLLEAPLWTIEREKLNSFDDVAQFRSNVEKNVGTEYSVYLQLNDDAPAEFNAFDDYFEITNSINIAYKLQYLSCGSGRYEVIPDTLTHEYEPGRFYTATIADDAPFHFYNKDPEIKKFHFNTHREDTYVYNQKEEVVEFDLNEVISKKNMEEVTSVTDELWVKTRHALNILPGQIFLFKYEEIDRHSFYGKCTRVSETDNTIYYVAPTLEEIFGEEGNLDVYCENYEPDEMSELVLCSEKSIHDDVLRSAALRNAFYKGYTDYVRANGGVAMSAKSWIEAMKDIRIIPKFGFYWPGWSFSLTVKVTVPFKAINITFMFQYYRKSTVTMTGSVSARKCAGIPYWADIACSVSEVIDSSFRFTICIGGQIPISDDDDKDFNHLSSYVTEQADSFENADNKFKTIKESKEEGVDFNGSALTIKLGTGRFPFGWIFDVFIDFNFVIKVDAQIMFGVTYTEHSTNTILSYNSGDDTESSNSVTELSSSSTDLSIIGTLGVDAGIHFRFGIGVCGLEDYISLSIYADIGVYLSLGGYVTWSWDQSGGSTTDFHVKGSFIFEVGWYADVGVQLSLFFVDCSADFVTIRKPFFTYGNKDFFLERPASGTDINIETSGLNFDDLHLLIVKHFSVTYMTVAIDEYSWDKEEDYLNDYGKMVTGNIFSFSFADGRYIKFEDGKLIVKDNAPAKFDDVLRVDVPKSLYQLQDGENHFLEVNIHYFGEYAREIKFDGVEKYAEYIGETIEIPGELEPRAGYEFYGWKEVKTGDVYAEGETYTVPDTATKHEPVEFESVYRVCFSVKFYDGLNNLIVERSVADGDPAQAPTDAARDYYMPENAIFVGWSTDFNVITCDLEVYAIYMYVD